MKTALILVVLLCLLFSFLSATSYSVNDLRNIFQHKLCLEGALDSFYLTKTDQTKEDTKVEGLLGLATLGKEEESEKPVLSRLNELAAHHQIEHYFTLIKEEGPPHERVFTISLTFGKETYVGEARSHKKAKQEAAAKALEKTGYDFPKTKEKNQLEVEKLTPTVLLNNLGSKLGVHITYYLLDKDKQEILHSNVVLTEKNKSYIKKLNDSIYLDKKLKMKRDIDATRGPFRIKLEFGKHIFYTTSHSIQSGRHEVATQALDFLVQNRDNLDLACLKEGSEEECKKDKDQLKSPVSKVYEQAQKRNLNIEFELVEESGRSHKRNFVTECRLGDKVTRGEGTSKKESKRNAAVNMLEKIKEMEPLPVEVEYKNWEEGRKKRKNKKKKLIKNKFDEISLVLDNMGKSVLGFAKNMFGEDDKIQNSDSFYDLKDGDTQNEVQNSPKQKRDTKFNDEGTKTSQNELLELSNILNFKVAFTDFDDTDEKKHVSLLSMYSNPEYTCFGEDKTEFSAREIAAKNALDLLSKNGIYDLFLEEKETRLEREVKEEIDVILKHGVSEKKEEL